MLLSCDCIIKKLFKKLPDLQFLTADRMSLVTPLSLNGWTVPLTASVKIQFTENTRISIFLFFKKEIFCVVN
jgi:hypothetical protein